MFWNVLYESVSVHRKFSLEKTSFKPFVMSDIDTSMVSYLSRSQFKDHFVAHMENIDGREVGVHYC